MATSIGAKPSFRYVIEYPESELTTMSRSPTILTPKVTIRLTPYHDTERAYVELRANDDDGGEVIATAIFTFHSKAATCRLSDNLLFDLRFGQFLGWIV